MFHIECVCAYALSWLLAEVTAAFPGTRFCVSALNVQQWSCTRYPDGVGVPAVFVALLGLFRVCSPLQSLSLMALFGQFSWGVATSPSSCISLLI